MNPSRHTPEGGAAIARARVVSLVAALGLIACGGDAVPPVKVETRPVLSDVTPTQWERLAGRKIFFGHQSVGNNILDGMRGLMAENPQIRLRLVESRYPAGLDTYRDLADRFPSGLADLEMLPEEFSGEVAKGVVR